MPRHGSKPSPSVTWRLIVTGALLWALLTYPTHPGRSVEHQALWWLGALLASLGLLGLVNALGAQIKNSVLFLRAHFGQDTSRGSAGWLTEREARNAGLHRRRKGSRFIGTLGRIALWMRTETHHLILGPAGSQKSSAAILNILMGNDEPALVSDVKKELWETTAAYRARKFGHRCVKIDPTDPEGSVKINPLDGVSRFLEAGDPAALTRTRGMMLQLHPDPQGGGNQNQFFYDGARSLKTTVTLCVCAIMPPEHRTLAMVYKMISDLDLLNDLLTAAQKLPDLNGEIADMAASLHAMAFGENGAERTFEQFRMGALQALEAFGPGNYLAAIINETTFSLTELKTAKTSVYLTIDFANSTVLGKFSGLMQWLAAEELVAVGNNKPVLFVLDEFCNAPLYTLPKILTLLRTYGVKCILATQDLDDITRVYSKHALESVLSETDIKQILGGIRSQTTLEYISKYIGETTETSSSFSLGETGTQESLGRTGRRLITEDELRRLPPEAQIVLYGNHKPILAKKVQVFAISPWRWRIAPNSLYGGKRKFLPIEVEIGWTGARITRRGRRAYRRLLRAMARREPRRHWRALAHLAGLLVPGPTFLLCLALAAMIWSAGFPNLRWEYTYRTAPARDAPVTYIACRYVGPTSPGRIAGPHCPLLLWRKTW
ncbi:MAG: type IV secretory system conjugative DNA transfer family protein [Pseudomonadota bacterium]